jgi:hypothetical protein
VQGVVISESLAARFDDFFVANPASDSGHLTGGWDHSIRVWALPKVRGGRGWKAPVPSLEEQGAVADAGGGEREADVRHFADKLPPYEPQSLKNDMGLAQYGKVP